MTKFVNEWQKFIVESRETLAVLHGGRFTQAQFAQRFGLSEHAVYKYERGLVERPHPNNEERLRREIAEALADHSGYRQNSCRRVRASALKAEAAHRDSKAGLPSSGPKRFA